MKRNKNQKNKKDSIDLFGELMLKSMQHEALIQYLTNLVRITNFLFQDEYYRETFRKVWRMKNEREFESLEEKDISESLASLNNCFTVIQAATKTYYNYFLQIRKPLYDTAFEDVKHPNDVFGDWLLKNIRYPHLFMTEEGAKDFDIEEHLNDFPRLVIGKVYTRHCQPMNFIFIKLFEEAKENTEARELFDEFFNSFYELCIAVTPEEERNSAEETIYDNNLWHDYISFAIQQSSLSKTKAVNSNN